MSTRENEIDMTVIINFHIQPIVKSNIWSDTFII